MAYIPYIDPAVKYMGVSRLREFNSDTLRDLDETIVIQDKNDLPLVVILNYATFLDMQAKITQAEGVQS